MAEASGLHELNEEISELRRPKEDIIDENELVRVRVRVRVRFRVRVRVSDGSTCYYDVTNPASMMSSLTPLL